MQTEIRQLFEARTSVRRYEYDPIPAEAMETIYAAIRNSPTSYNGQQLSVIDIADQEVKLRLYEITGQKQIKSTKTGVQETTRTEAYTDRKPGPDKQRGSTGMCFPAPEST